MEEYIIASVVGKLLITLVPPLIVAVQLIKDTLPKFARGDSDLKTVGLSTIHSADNWLDV